MAVVAQEARIVVRLVDAVLEEVQGVAGRLPVGKDGRHVVVDGHVGVLIDRFADPPEIPTPIVVVAEQREVEGLVRSDDEEVADAWVLPNLPASSLGEDQAIIPPADDPWIGVRVLRIDQLDATVGVDAEDRREGVV